MKQFLRRFLAQAPRPWLITWVVVYALIIIFNLLAPAHPLSVVITISSIVLCFIYALIRSPQDRLLVAALAVTVIADFFLDIHNTSPIGLVVFVAAQLIHLFRTADKKYHKIILAFIIFAALLIATCFITEFAPPIHAICAVYAVVIVCNILACWCWHRTDSQSLPAALAAYGFILFACCDLCVAISYLSFTALLPAVLYGIANFLAWFFYYPSQILISNSGKYVTMSTVEGKKLMEVYGR